MNLFDKGKEDTKGILDVIKKKKLVKRYFILILSMFISAIYFNLLQLPTQIVTGGTSGLAIILNSVIGIEPSVVIFVLQFLLLIVGFIFLGTEKSSGAVLSAILYPIFVEITANIGSYITVDISDKILVSIFTGILSGLTTGMVYKVGFSNGGFSIISEIITKYKKVSLSGISFVINFIIVVLGGLSFGWTMVMYAAIILYIHTIILDRVLIGVSKNKAMYIITDKEEELQDYIMNGLKHGVTIFDVKGGFLEKKRKVLMTVIPNREYFKLKEGIKEIDEKAFFIVTDSYQVYGGE